MTTPITKDTVQQWLTTIGCNPIEFVDPTAAWHFEFDYPAGMPNRLHVVEPSSSPNQVLIAAVTNIDQVHLDAFGRLDDDGKEEFLWALRRTLNRVEVDFIFAGVKTEMECPTRFEVRVVRYADGLSLDSFAHSLGAVFKVQLAAIWVVNEHLGGKSFGTGGRFDFKKLGF